MYKFTTAMSVEDVETALERTTIFDRIEHTGITKAQVLAKIHDLRERQVPQRTVLPDMDDELLAECWFKNWLHPILKHMVEPSPRDKRGCSPKVLKMDQRRDFLHFCENGQQNFNYTLADVEAWAAED